MANWQEIMTFIRESNRDVKLLEGDEKTGREECFDLNIPEKSLLYEIVCNTGGIVIDDWIRIFGQTKDNIGISHYNKEFGASHEMTGLFVVASDIVGGLFAININRFEDEANSIWYFAPDTLEWECLEMKYSEFFSWALQGNIDEFYETMRWNGWKKDAKEVGFDQGILIYPFLWANECIIDKADKKAVPLDELVALNFETEKRLFEDIHDEK